MVWITEWRKNDVEGHGGYFRHLRHKEWTKVSVFDEAQMTYWNGELWLSLFKDLADYKTLQAILFASYGNPTSRVGENSRIPILLQDEQQVTLKAIRHNDHLPAIGHLFTRDELGELISALRGAGILLR